MPGFSLNIEKETLKNKNYRKVIHTTAGQQLVLMSLEPGEIFPEEIHPKTTQFFRVEEGSGIAIVSGKKIRLRDGISITVSPGAKHIIKNTSRNKPLKLYTIYSPPHHPPKKINKRQPF